jgi:hypothetical protein
MPLMRQEGETVFPVLILATAMTSAGRGFLQSRLRYDRPRIDRLWPISKAVMMRRFVLIVLVLLTPALARADYIDLKRAAVLKAGTQSGSEVIEHLHPGVQLRIIQDTQQNGYYRVHDDQTGNEGWLYRTFGRRYQGVPDQAVTKSSTPSGAAGVPGPPTEDAFAPPLSHVWRNAAKTDNCKTTNGLPDTGCTPGEILTTETEETICSSNFHTSAIRNSSTTAAQKNHVYPMYGIPHPSGNTGSNQVCEIDHLVSLELGGADTISNLWPECSAGYAQWQGPGFRDKDGFENYLWFHVCKNQDLTLKEAQTEIATNWRHYWELAGKPECRNRNKCE